MFSVTVALLSLAASAQVTHNWQSDGSTLSGNFDAVAHWDAGTVPNDRGNATVDDVPGINIGGTYTVTATKTMFPTGLQHRYFQAKPASGDVTIALSGNGDTDRFDWDIGSAGETDADPIPFLDLSGGNVTLNLSHVDVYLDSADMAKGGIVLNNGSKLVAVGGSIHMPGGGPSNKQVDVLGATSEMRLYDTDFNADRLNVTGLFRFDGTTAGAPSGAVTRNNPVIYSGGRAEWLAGTFSSGGIMMYSTGSQVLIDGCAYSTGTGTVRVGSSSGGSLASDNLLEVRSGSMIGSGTVSIAGAANGTATSKVLISGGTVGAGSFNIGFYTSVAGGRTGRGEAEMSAGTLIANTLNVGEAAGGASGLYKQTGGWATVGQLGLRKGTWLDAFAFFVGSERFVVGAGAGMTLTGTGMALGGTDDWLMDFGDAGDFDTRGTFAFDPAAGVTSQTLIGFAEDRGHDSAAFGLNTAIGTLDLTALDPGETLSVIEAGSFGTNAIYVNNLLGLTPDALIADNVLDSTLTLYYDGANLANRPLIAHPFYDLPSGGRLVGVDIPEPSTVVLLALAGLAAVRRRRPSRR